MSNNEFARLLKDRGLGKQNRPITTRAERAMAATGSAETDADAGGVEDVPARGGWSEEERPSLEARSGPRLETRGGTAGLRLTGPRREPGAGPVADPGERGGPSGARRKERWRTGARSATGHRSARPRSGVLQSVRPTRVGVGTRAPNQFSRFTAPGSATRASARRRGPCRTVDGLYFVLPAGAEGRIGGFVPVTDT